MADHISPRIPVVHWSDRELCEEMDNYILGNWPTTEQPELTVAQVIEEFVDRELKLEDSCVEKVF